MDHSIVLPPRDVAYLDGRGIAYEDGSQPGQVGVVLKGIALPDGKFDAASADILVVLPPGYPDCPPDMFYCLPWLKLRAANRYPRAADQQHPFRGQIWQRWSRHNNTWRPGIDGIHTMVKRIERALAEAA